MKINDHEHLEIGKFDVILMNAPYQPPVDRSREEAKRGTGRRRACGSRNTLWPRFVKLGLRLCKDDGHCAFIHPPLWRKPGHALWPVLSPLIRYLEMHDAGDGKATFGAQIRYDWYVLDKAKNGGPAVVVDQDGNRREMDLSEWSWLPSGMFDDFRTILAGDGDDRLEVLYSRSRHAHDRAGTSSIKSGTFPHPCIHALHKSGGVKLYYASSKSEFFVPKVILCEGGFPYPMIDAEGAYGLTEYCFAIRVGSEDEAAKIKAAIESDRFKEMLSVAKWSAFRTEHAMFSYFRRDFWLQFLDDERREAA